VKLHSGSVRAQSSGPGKRVGRSPGWAKGGFFDANQVRIERKQKILKMKVAPNKLMKTKGQKRDIMDYPNKCMKKGELTEFRYYFMKINGI
jgi:hypothetical protein